MIWTQNWDEKVRNGNEDAMQIRNGSSEEKLTEKKERIERENGNLRKTT